MFICNFRSGLLSNPFQYDPKKDLACMGNKSNCSVICRLLKIAFLGKWDERGERHTSGHSPVSQIATHILCILSSTVSPPALNSSAWTSSGPVALQLAVWRMARATSERSGGGSCSQYSCSFLSLPHHSTSLHNTLSTCLRFVQLQSNFCQLLTQYLVDVGETFESLTWLSGRAAWNFLVRTTCMTNPEQIEVMELYRVTVG